MSTRRWILAGALSAAVIATVTYGFAAPPPGADPNSDMARWFQSLRQPGTGSSCCSLSDCRLTDYRAGASGYEAMVAGRWIAVPQDKILRGITNPTGRAVVCARPEGTILCFVTPDET
jgi:hypothetical protein